MSPIIAFFLIWFIISIPITFFVGAVLGLAKKSSKPEKAPAPRRNVPEAV